MFAKSPFTHRKPLKISATVSVPAGGSATATIGIPAGGLYSVKGVTVTKGANTTVSGISFDGEESGQTDTFDCVTVFGDTLTAQFKIEATATNAGAAAEDLTIEVVGVRL